MNSVKDLLTVVGGLLGAITFFWRIWDTLISYLSLDVEVHGSTALVKIENKGMAAKRVHYAALLIAAENEPTEGLIASLAPQLFPEGLLTTAGPLFAVADRRPAQAVYAHDGTCALVPLPFFFDDQNRIGNETIKYRQRIEVDRLAGGRAFTVKLYVFVRYPLGIIRWRTTADLIEVGAN